MDFSLTLAQEKIQQVAREFAINEVAPLAEEIDREGKFPHETFEKMRACGFTSIGIPEEYGGSGGDDITKAIVVMEIAKKCGATAAILSINGIFGQSILMFGTEEQKAHYLPLVSEGGKKGAFALTEPNAGSDAAAAKTRAIKEGDEYVITGTKCFITGGSIADYVLVIALTDPSKGVRGMSAIIVPTDTPGFAVGKIEDKMGIRASETAEIIFDNCRVPTKNLLGKEGQGFKIAMMLLDELELVLLHRLLALLKGLWKNPPNT